MQPELHGHHIYISLDNWRISYHHIPEVSLFYTIHCIAGNCIFSTLSVWNVALIWKQTDDKNLKSIRPWLYSRYIVSELGDLRLITCLTILKTYVSYVKPTLYRLAQGSIKLSWKSSGTKATVTVVWVSMYRQFGDVVSYSVSHHLSQEYDKYYAKHCVVKWIVMDIFLFYMYTE